MKKLAGISVCHSRESGNPVASGSELQNVCEMSAGVIVERLLTHAPQTRLGWIPAFAGMTQ